MKQPASEHFHKNPKVCAYRRRMQSLRHIVQLNWVVAAIIFLVDGVSVAAEEMRVWTDVKGRTVEARLIEIGTDKIRVNLNGKNVDIPLSNLSEADRMYVEKLEESGFSKASDEDDGKAVAPASDLTFDGKELKIGGIVNVYDYEYDEKVREDLAKALKGKAEDTGYRIGVAVPADFDPQKPQKVFVVMAPGNDAQQKSAGNLRMLGLFAKSCTDAGWVCVSYDSDLGLATLHLDAYIEAMKKISKVWPGLEDWTLATGGISGGAGGAQVNTILLLSMGYKVTGLFQQGSAGHGPLNEMRKNLNVKPSELRNTRCFISAGRSDKLISADGVEKFKEGLEREGITKIKTDWYDGGHELNFDQLKIALDWFAQEEP